MVALARGQRFLDACRKASSRSETAIARCFGRFGRDERGGMAIWSIYMFLMMLMVAGIGVDFMLNEMKRTRLQATLDRAVLAAADLDQTLSPKGVVQSYFDKSGMGDFLAETAVTDGLNFRSVSADASSQTRTLFIDMLGIDYLSAPAVGTAEEEIPNIEISLILDISGSMRYNNRMNNLKPAAEEFISTVLRGNAADTTSVNVVPYAGQTNPGPVMFDYLNGVRYHETGADHFPEWAQDISNVVFYYDTEEPFGTVDEDDFAVKIDGFPDSGTGTHISNDLDDFFHLARSYIASQAPDLDQSRMTVGVSIKGGRQATEYYAYEEGGTAAPDSGPTDFRDVDLELSYSDFFANQFPNVSSCLELESADFTHSGLPQTGLGQVPHFMYWDIAANVMDWGWCPEDDTRIQYAQNDESSLRGFIRDIRMHDGTGTHYALKWGLSLLDPATRPAFTHLAGHGQVPADFTDRPSDWNAEGWRKVIVLMTDGQITDQYRPTEPMNPDNATVELQNQSSSKREQLSSRSTNLSRFYALCNFAKDNGVTVYTISFEAPSNARTEMRNCASSPSHYFDVDGLEISDAFVAIASQINQLRLTQ